MHLPYADGSFDRAWALESMFRLPDKRQALAETARVVRPGGRVAIADIIFVRDAGERTTGPADPTAAFSSLSTLREYDPILRAAGLLPVELTDVSRQTARNHIAYIEWLRKGRKGRYVEVLGKEGFELFVGSQETRSRLNELSYALISAQRP